MLKAIVSYSKKIPVPGSEFSSQGYSLSLETEIPETEPGAIQARLSQTFRLVKDHVEQELANGSGKAATPPGSGAAAARPDSGNGAKASNKQIKFITDLATQRGMGLSDLNGDVRKRYNVASL